MFGISFDTHDAATVARFWAAVLGRQLADGADAVNAVVLTGDIATSGPRLAFHQVPEGKTVKNRVHLDLTTTDLDSESCTPCDSSETVSLSGQRVAAIRARSASISASGISILNGRIAGASVDSSVVIDTSASSVCGSM